VSYIFGDLKNYQSTEVPIFGTLNSRVEQDNAIGGLNYDYGLQYTVDLSLTRHIVFGYSASANSKLNSQSTYIVSQYLLDAQGNANVAADSIINQQNAKTKIQLPQINHFGISYQKDEKYLVGIDYTMGNWSSLTIGGTNQGLRDSKTFNVGGQFTPNLNAINNYWLTVDYRLGFMYDQTYLKLSNPTGPGTSNINSYAFTFGLGLPLRANNASFYKINISAEVGKRGTLNNGLVKENYINLHLGFLLNDTWFRKYKFD
jgi:long-subunit fatty acid transport protein